MTAEWKLEYRLDGTYLLTRLCEGQNIEIKLTVDEAFELEFSIPSLFTREQWDMIRHSKADLDSIKLVGLKSYNENWDDIFK